ncbi:hypothetical protein PpBr36_08445 [Pyricularia pennisetigena]|uniref:hypothetical protein n=1 Tax=Pyricularia pennisetigena TaxID=1578925 RepID=UPI001151C6CB|nr:hypothetical protein PpBr36_08445 [Pyricularia pennisetigena]TLS24327.1 hypothetical protein PpBr36_08445 [Pyricularia pennisetigena]
MAPRKRKAPATPKRPEPVSSSRRRSTRIGSSAEKSKYFESDSGSGSDSDDGHAVKRVKTGHDVKYSGRRGPKVESDASEDEYEAPDDDDDEEEEEEEVDADDASGDGSEEEQVRSKPHKPSKKKEAKPPVKTARDRKNDDSGKEDDDDDDDDDEDNLVTFIPHVKLRELDGVEYADEKLHKNTLLFLKDLKANNVRSWLKSNDAEYRRSLTDWNSFIETLTPRIVDVDDTIPELPAKDIVFRIYRDIRFSKDPTPYKPHYSAVWSRAGRKGPYACYYLHCEPGGRSFAGGGLWHPEAESLRRLRASIDERPRRWRKALVEDDRLRRTFLPKAKKGDEKSIFKAFAAANANDALKKKPRDYPQDHRYIELLKLRSFTISKKIADDVFTSDDGVDQLIGIFGDMVGYVTHLNSIVMPEDGDDDDDDDDDEDDDNANGEATDATE